MGSVKEGTSDANALAAPLQNLLSAVNFGDFQVRCDVTTARLFSKDFEEKHGFKPGWDVRVTVDRLVDEYLTRESKEPTSLGWIAHLTDLDGAYIPDANITTDSTLEDRAYSLTGIVSPDADVTRTEQAEKRRCIDMLVDQKTSFQRNIKKTEDWRVPYRLFFMSRNLEHALYGIINSLGSDDKEDHAARFALNNSNQTVFKTKLDNMAQQYGNSASWEESWQYARDRSTCHSLVAGSNLKWIEDFVASCKPTVLKVG